MEKTTQKQAGERTQFTPGPWRQAEGHYITGSALSAGVHERRNVAMVVTDYANGPGAIPLDVREANARLIAAAPELLAALNELVAQCIRYANEDDCDLPDTYQAEQAIARATEGA